MLNRREFIGTGLGVVAPGVTIEQDLTAHRKYLVETLKASLNPMK
jgi:hypothetical protein